jgi:hypothetical protein
MNAIQPIHPNVQIVKSLLSLLKPGETASYEEISRAIGEPVKSRGFEARVKSAMRALHREGVNISRIKGESFLREDCCQSISRVQVRELKSMERKSRKTGRTLANINVSELPDAKKPDYFAMRTINNIVYAATQPAACKRVLAIARTSNAVIPMADALLAIEK